MNPVCLVRGDAPAWHDAVDVRVMQEVLSPGVQNAQKADGRPEMLGVGRDFQQRIRTGLEQ